MSKAKPFLFGTALGASAMFFSLQYHVVHSHDGFQVIPRTPQQSIGLAYADIRGWTPSQWTDRPELARALMAHGSSDLISESVAGTLADTVTEDSSTLDELRNFLNNSKKKVTDEAEGLLRIPGGAESRSDAPGFSENSSPIPFPQDLTQKGTTSTGPADPFRDSDEPKGSRTSPPGTLADSRSSRFTVGEVLSGLQEDESEDVFKPVTEPEPKRSGGTSGNTPKQKSSSSQKSILDEAREMEDRIFGGAENARPNGTSSRSTAPKSTTGTSKPSTVVPSKSGSLNDYGFDEVATELENRAQDVLNRAEESAKSQASDMTDAAGSYVRERANKLPEAAKNAVQGSGQKIPADFDPFLE
ncbi:MAG: hypothetical protein U0996_00400 [Planctomycetaceae bacterium]